MAKITRIWFVAPNELKGDGKQWRGPDNVVQGRGEDGGGFAQEVRPRDARRAQPVALDAPEADEGYGFGITSADAKGIMAFTSKARATEYAKYQATMQPTKLFSVFACEQMYETTTPAVIEKKFNDAGELVLVPGV